MKAPVVVVLVVLSIVAIGAWADEKADLSHGFGDGIAWKSYADAVAYAKDPENKNTKPTLVLLHKTWCGACKRLKPEFAGSKEIEALSEKFLMVNAEDDEAPHDNPSFVVDGGYIPRLFFLDPQGELDASLYNTAGSPQYKYFYANAGAVVAGMQRALDKYSSAHADL
eukprot:TRINITY_DN265_c0_g1_i1.p1 TRINITY_DN265_c0_g1~~TRINITY_DN265_c0_g1_i1.p1  ORF type:complete len:175 (-),score=31.99 TRINITY_DN265_c0_g1_i1:42-545(-)